MNRLEIRHLPNDQPEDLAFTVLGIAEGSGSSIFHETTVDAMTKALALG